MQQGDGAKLVVGAANDPAEAQAEAMAERVVSAVRAGAAREPPPHLHRYNGEEEEPDQTVRRQVEEEEEEEEPIQTVRRQVEEEEELSAIRRQVAVTKEEQEELESGIKQTGQQGESAEEPAGARVPPSQTKVMVGAASQTSAQQAPTSGTDKGPSQGKEPGAEQAQAPAEQMPTAATGKVPSVGKEPRTEQRQAPAEQAPRGPVNEPAQAASERRPTIPAAEQAPAPAAEKKTEPAAEQAPAPAKQKPATLPGEQAPAPAEEKRTRTGRESAVDVLWLYAVCRPVHEARRALAGRGTRSSKARRAHGLLSRSEEALRSVRLAYEKKPKTKARMDRLVGDLIDERDHLAPHFGQKYPWEWITDTVALVEKDLVALLKEGEL